MIASCTTLLICCLALGDDGAYPGTIEGVVLDGSHADVPLAGAEVVLLAGQGRDLLPVSKATADEQGRFVFSDLPVDRHLTYLCGANRGGVHYPGPRVNLTPAKTAVRIELKAYAAIEHPSPLTVESHKIDIQMLTGALEVIETMRLANNSGFAYVGDSTSGESPETFHLSIPKGFERVTFAKEFHGRRFNIKDGKVVTDIPWPPGERTLEFRYRLPIEEDAAFTRKLDLPTSQVFLRVSGENCSAVSANLVTKLQTELEATFVSDGNLPAGQIVQLQLTRRPVPWNTYGRWGSVGVLVALAIGTLVTTHRRRRSGDATGLETRRNQRIDTGHVGKTTPASCEANRRSKKKRRSKSSS